MGSAIVLITTGCGSASQPPTATPATPLVFPPEATVRDLMAGLIDTSADAVWLSVMTTVSKEGVIETRPRNEEEWAQVRYGALRLVESANLLMIPGRRMARPGEKSIAPGIELEPAEIQAMVDKDRDGWNQRAKALYDAAMLAVRAAEAQDPEKILDVGETIEASCEGCHRHFWYPNEPKLPPASK
jgi:hypothetical protein